MRSPEHHTKSPMGKHLICIIQNGHTISILCCISALKIAYSSDSKIWKSVFGHKKAFGMVQSLIRRMAN